jgi:putative Ca2+/H+ antiporter (TMEM165/GDT1 family)
MEALVTAFVAACLALWGDKAQLIVASLSAASKRPGQVLAGLFLAALASSALGAWLGTLVAAMITIRAMTLMCALALLFGGGAALFRRKPPAAAPPPRWPLVAAFILCLAAELGGGAQFLTFALAGRFHAPELATAGATAGILAACLPAALLGDRLQTTIPVRAIRYAVAALFLIAGFITAMTALQLT